MKWLAKLARVPRDLWQMLVTALPGPFGDWLRHRFWKRRLRWLGTGTKIDVGVNFENPEWISIDDRCWIDRNVLILAGPARKGRKTETKVNAAFEGEAGEVRIGARTHIAPNVVISGIGGVQIGEGCGVASGAAIYSYSHHYRAGGDREDRMQYAFSPLVTDAEQSMISGAIVMGDRCAVGLHAVLLPGTTLGRGTWVASGIVASGAHPEQTLVHEKRATVAKPIEGLVLRTAETKAPS